MNCPTSVIRQPLIVNNQIHFHARSFLPYMNTKQRMKDKKSSTLPWVKGKWPSHPRIRMGVFSESEVWGVMETDFPTHPQRVFQGVAPLGVSSSLCAHLPIHLLWKLKPHWDLFTTWSLQKALRHSSSEIHFPTYGNWIKEKENVHLNIIKLKPKTGSKHTQCPGWGAWGTWMEEELRPIHHGHFPSNSLGVHISLTKQRAYCGSELVYGWLSLLYSWGKGGMNRLGMYTMS